jgi:hypothetical protein
MMILTTLPSLLKEKVPGLLAMPRIGSKDVFVVLKLDADKLILLNAVLFIILVVPLKTQVLGVLQLQALVLFKP